MMLLQPRSWFCINYDDDAEDVDGGDGEDVKGEDDDLEDVGDSA